MTLELKIVKNTLTFQICIILIFSMDSASPAIARGLMWVGVGALVGEGEVCVCVVCKHMPMSVIVHKTGSEL